MTTQTPQRPSLFFKVMSRLLIAALLALCFQAAYTIFVAFSDRLRVANAFVRVETSALLENATLRDGRLDLPVIGSLARYANGQSPKYGFRIFDENGKVLSSRNDALFSNFIEHTRFKPGHSTSWASVNSKRPFWIAGGRPRKINGHLVYAEVATLGDPAWRRSVVFSRDVLINRLIALLPVLVMTIGLAALLVHGALLPLRQAAENAGKANFEDLALTGASSGLSSEGAELVAALNRATSGRREDMAPVGKDLSQAIHDTRSSLALITLQLNKLQGRPARQIEADVDTVTGLIEKISALSKKGAGKVA